MFKTIAALIVLVIGGFLAYVATRPDTFHVERSATIRAPADKVHALIDDFERWSAWSPWERKDPAMQRSFGPTTRGKGARYEWVGNDDVGQGSMEIVESTPPSTVAIKLDFVKPFEAHNMVRFSLQPQGEATHVTWAMHGAVPYLAKIVHLFFDMDAMVGKDFEAGLANLKSAAER